MLFNAAILLLFLLPGFMSYRFAVWNRPDPDKPSYLWQLAEMLEHAFYIHFAAVLVALLSFLISMLLFDVENYIEVFIFTGFQEGLLPWMREHSLVSACCVVGYGFYVVIASVICGRWDIPRRVYGVVLWVIRSRSAAHFPQVSVWYQAMRGGGSTSTSPAVRVNMKNGEVYDGCLLTYPLVPDTCSEKDIIIGRAIHHRLDGTSTDLTVLDGRGIVLLNTVNISSIQCTYSSGE